MTFYMMTCENNTIVNLSTVSFRIALSQTITTQKDNKFQTQQVQYYFSNRKKQVESSEKVIQASDKLTQKEPSLIFADSCRPIKVKDCLQTSSIYVHSSTAYSKNFSVTNISNMAKINVRKNKIVQIDYDDNVC